MLTIANGTAKQQRRREPLARFFEQQRHRLHQQVDTVNKQHKIQRALLDAPLARPDGFNLISEGDDLVFEFRR